MAIIETALDVPVVFNIPPIHRGASWHSFDLSFYQDVAETIPLNLAPLPLKSQIFNPETEERQEITILPGDLDNQLKFRLTQLETVSLTPGLWDWDVFVDINNFRDVVVVGNIYVLVRATLYGVV